MENEIPVRRSHGGKYRLTEEDKAYITSFSKDGVIPFLDYVMAMNHVLNKSSNIEENFDESPL